MDEKLKRLIDDLDNIEKRFTIYDKVPFKGTKVIYKDSKFNKWKTEFIKELNNYVTDNSIIRDCINRVLKKLDKEWNGFKDQRDFEELKMAIANLVEIL